MSGKSQHCSLPLPYSALYRIYFQLILQSLFSPSAMSEIQSVDLGAHLRTPSVHAYVADQIEEASLKVPVFNQLHRLAEVRDRRPFACSTMLISLQRDFALEHYMWVEDAHDVSIFCTRSGNVGEATLFVTGVVSKHSTMPYNTFQEYVSVVALPGMNHSPNF